MHDVIIVGGGPAGLSAALVLGRCRRQVLICDSGEPRNYASHELHGFLTQDCIHPMELRRIGREQLARYPGVEFREIRVTGAERRENHFVVKLSDGSSEAARILLLATGVVDELPPVKGLKELYGKGVWHCPYCDGWENRDVTIAVYGHGEEGVDFALELKGWSDDLILCTDGNELPGELQERLKRHGIRWKTAKIDTLEEREGKLSAVLFTDSERLPLTALFFMPGQYQRSPLSEQLGCEVTDGGVVETGKFQSTCVPGLFIAGDAARSVQLAIVAAAEGAEAAFAINTALLKADYQ